MDALQKLLPYAGMEFVKMTGSGNDFIIIDNRKYDIAPEVMSLMAQALCKRALSIGADGLVMLSTSDRVDPERGRIDFRWDFYNSDGSEAEMCGNASRCVGRYAHDIGLAGKNMTFDTIAGPIGAEVAPDGDEAVVKVQMTKPFDAYWGLGLDVEGAALQMDGMNTGVPHAVIEVDAQEPPVALEDVPLMEWGAGLRYHQHFAPAGTNVNFMQFKDDMLHVRTYERGVEGETLACGTGSVACALVAAKKHGLTSPVKLTVASGEEFLVYYDYADGEFDQVYYQGKVAYVYKGILEKEAFAWMAN